MTTKKTGIALAVESLARLKKGEDAYKNTQDVFVRPPDQEVKPGIILTKELLWKLFKKHSSGKYMITPENKEVLFTVFRYFLNDPEFNSAGLIQTEPSLDKGILIFGDVGIGKTFLFETLHKAGRELLQFGNSQLWFSSISAGSFIEQYMTESKNGSFHIEKYYTGKLYIDDLGFETKAFNKTEVLGELLFERDRKKSKTFVTTNLHPEEIGQRYGERIEDRLHSMFNIIKWNGESFRK